MNVDKEISDDLYNSADEAAFNLAEKTIADIEKVKNGVAVTPDVVEQQEQDTSAPVEDTIENPEEAQEEEHFEEEKAKPPKKEEKLWKIKKEKYKYLAQKEALARENAELRELLDKSLNSGTHYYAKTAYNDLEFAKSQKIQAIEKGDVDALVDADIAVNKALNAINEIEKLENAGRYNNSQAHSNRQDDPYSDYSSEEIQRELVSDWLDDHIYLQPDSPNYDGELAAKVSKFVNYLDNRLAKSGAMHHYLSDDYFEEVNRYIESIKSPTPASPQQVKNLQRPHNPPPLVGGVRNAYPSLSSKRSPTNQITLTAEEKVMCTNAGISEEKWLEHKIKELTQQ